MLKRFLLLIPLFFKIAIVVIVAAGAAFAWWSYRPLVLAQTPVQIAIEPGSSMRTIARAIAAQGVPAQPLLLQLLARAQGSASQLKAGTYEFASGITPVALLDKLRRGEVVQITLTIPEGWSFRQMRDAIAAHPGIRQTLAGASEEDLLRAIGAAEDHPEGLFFPDTYLFARGTADVEIYKRAYASLRDRLNAAWDTRAADLPYRTPYEALIMASIVEKETGRNEDRAMIAGVFVNRLRLGMLLQTDPSVIYGTSAFDGNLRKRDLLSDHAYNTYTRAGLPPTPIALPGAASITAALHPADTRALFFVSRGDGSSHFSDNLNEHNRAVNQYQKAPKRGPK